MVLTMKIKHLVSKKENKWMFGKLYENIAVLLPFLPGGFRAQEFKLF